MKNKFIYLFLAFFCVVLLLGSFSVSAKKVYESAVGSWDVSGTMKGKTMGEKIKLPFYDSFTYNSDGSFKTIETGEGTWTQKKDKVKMYMSDSEVMDVVNGYLNDWGFDWIIVESVKVFKMEAKVKNSQLKSGKFQIKVYISVPDYDIYHKKLQIDGKFTGYRTSYGLSLGSQQAMTLSDETASGNSNNNSFMAEITKKIVEEIKSMKK